MKRVRPSLAFVLVLLVLASVLVTSTTWRRTATPVGEAPLPAADTVPVSNTTLVCPDASALTGESPTEVTVVAPLLDASGGDGGDGGADGQSEGVGLGSTTVEGEGASVQTLAPATTLATLNAHGPAASATVTRPDLGPVVVRTVGDLAPGVSASQLTLAGAGEVTGLASVSCREPAAEWWFLGLGTEIGHRPRLSVVNVEPVVAEVDVVLHGPDGEVPAPGLTDVAVPPGGALTFELETVAPDLAELAVEVKVRVGRVLAAVRDSRVEGLGSSGLDWVTPAAAPAARVVVPGVRGGGGERLLHLLAPGDADTRVAVRLLTSTGSILPVGLEEVELSGGVVRAVDLASVLGQEVAAVELTAAEPVVAGLRVVTDSEPREMAYTGGAEPLSGPAVVSDVRTGDGWSAELMLSADDGASTAARVQIDYLDAGSGEVLGSELVNVEGGASVAVPLDPEGEAGADAVTRFAAVVTPLDGVVYAATWLRRTEPGAGLTVLPLFSPPLDVEVPRVRHDLSTGLRPRG